MAKCVQIQSCLGNYRPRNCNSCKQSASILLHEAALPLLCVSSAYSTWLVPTSIFVTADSLLHSTNWNNYRSGHKTIMWDGELYIQAIRGALDRSSRWTLSLLCEWLWDDFQLHVYCAQWAAAAGLCSFLLHSQGSKSCLWATQPQGYQRHRTAELYKPPPLNDVCVLYVCTHMWCCVCVLCGLYCYCSCPD